MSSGFANLPHTGSRHHRPHPHSAHRPLPVSSLLTGAYPHGLLLQDQKVPALPGGKQAGTLHAPGAEGQPDHGGGEKPAPGSPSPSSLLTEHQAQTYYRSWGHGSRRGRCSLSPPEPSRHKVLVKQFIDFNYDLCRPRAQEVSVPLSAAV